MGAKKKLSKKEKARLEAEQAELLRIEMEKEKQRKLEEERIRKQREREEAEKRQKLEIIENRTRRMQLKESVQYFDKITQEIDKIRDNVKQQNEWEHYMRCNGLPDANNPGDLRKYIHMWQMSANENQATERNWLLKTNERTILTQDKSFPDLTKEHLRKCQANLGDLYSQRIQEILGVLKEVDLEVGDSNDSNKIPKARLDDLKLLKREIRLCVSQFIDDFTFRILSHVERDMECTLAGMSEHVYESSVFKTQVWMILANAPKTNNKDKFKENNRHAELNFQLLKMYLTLPHSFKLLNSAIRGLWLNYDHFSDYCTSFYMPKLIVKHFNILEQTKKEWKKRKEILRSTLEQVTKESSPSSFDSAEDSQRRVIDVDKIYTEYEDDLNRARRRALGPDALNLSEFDVNLRSHRIVGGLYCIDHLDQPQQDKRLNHSSFIRSITLPNKLNRKDFYQAYKQPPPPQAGVRRLPEEIEAEMKAIEQNLDKLVTITLDLPGTVLWFEPPIVCRWEKPNETSQSERTTTTDIRKQSLLDARKSTDRGHFRSKSLSKILSTTKPSKIVYDFDMYNIPKTVDMYGIMNDFVVPRLPNGYCIAIDLDESEDATTTAEPNMKYMKKDSVTKKNFQVQTIVEKLVETDSPRTLHFTFSFDKILQVTQTSTRNPTDSESSEIDGQLQQQYMFSQLVEDLDLLCELRLPFLDEHIAEINSKFSSARSSRSENVHSRRFSNVIILRETDIMKKEQTIAEVKPKLNEESDSEMEDEEIEKSDELDNADEIDGIPTGTTSLKHDYGHWSTRDVHDVKFNEDKLSIQFRTGRIGYFGFAANRYSNMPYQTWEIKPDFKGSVIFTITAAVISLEIFVTDQGYRVNAFQGGTTESLTELIGRLHSLEHLKEILTEAAVNIFPDEDAFCYTEGSCEKNYVMEMHLYACMASLALSHNFSWSRWNLLSGSRAAVLLLRELQEGKKVPNHSTLFVTPLRASIVDCTEVSASFSTTGVAGMEFYADLYHLAKEHSLLSSKKQQDIMNPVLRSNIQQILQAVRPLSFC